MTVVEGFPLTPQQRQIWKHARERGSTGSGLVILLEGPLRAERLRQSLKVLVARHDILRTRFPIPDGLTTPLQVVSDEAVFSWREWKSSEAEIANSHRLLRPYSQSPSIDARLLSSSPDRHALILSLAAIQADGRSQILLLSELADIYRALSEGWAVEEQPVQYTQFGQWLAGLAAERGEGRAYWESQPRIETSAFPLEKKPSGFLDHRCFDLAPEISGRLQPFAAVLGVSLRDVLMACWATLLARQSGTESLTIGHGAHGRSFEELETTLGPMTRFLPLTFVWRENQTPRDAAREWAGRIAAAENWQDYFGLEERHSRAVPGYLFCFDAAPDVVDADGVRFRMGARLHAPPPDALTLDILTRGEALELGFYFDRGRFEGRDIKCLKAQFEILLQAAVSNPDLPLGRLPMFTRSQRRRLLLELNPRLEAQPESPPVHRAFEHRAKIQPERVALVFQNRLFTYECLNQRANHLAHELIGRGSGPERPVALLLERSAEVIVGLLGILKAGATYLPLDPQHPEPRGRWLLRDSGATLLVGQNVPGDREGFDHLAWGRWPAQGEATNPRTPDFPDAAAYLIYTSGSSGRPKGVAVSHRNLAAYTLGIGMHLPLRACDSFALVAGAAADLGHTMIFPPLTFGGTVVPLARERIGDGRALGDFMRAHAIDCLKITPSHLAALLVNPRPGRVLPRKQLILGGEAAPPALLEQLERLAPQTRVFNHYGPTEATVGVATSAYQEQSHDLPLGRPLPLARLYVLNGQLEPVPMGITGELFIGGEQVTRGYWNDPLRTAQRFLPDPLVNRQGSRLYQTGDWARYREDGVLEFVGRRDFQVKIRGFRVAPEEVTAALNRHPRVREALVTAPTQESGTAYLAAHVVVADGSGGDAGLIQELRAHLLQNLPTHMVPARFLILDRFPRTASGKVERAALPDPEDERFAREGEHTAPRTALEEALILAWERVLGRSGIGVFDNFFALGGHSLNGTILIARINEDMGIRLMLADLFEAPTVADLARLVQRLRQETPWLESESGESQNHFLAFQTRRATSPLVALQPKGKLPPVFCVHGSNGFVFPFSALARRFAPAIPFFGVQASGLHGQAEPRESFEEMAGDYVTALVDKLPAGPVHLLGWSNGGFIALEMARTLKDAGREVGLLAVLDTYPRNPHKPEPAIEALMLNFAKLNFDVDVTPWLGGGIFQPENENDFVEQTLDQIARALPQEDGLTRLRCMWRVFQANTRAKARYEPRAYQGRITLISADAPEAFKRVQADFWHDLAAGGLEVYDTAGDHIAMIRDSDHVGELAQRLRACLSRNEPNPIEPPAEERN